LYGYCMNDPINHIDSNGLYTGVDDLTFATLGALTGLASQGFNDLLNGKLSGWEDYAGSALGGAASGWSMLYTGPVLAGAAGGAVGNISKQFLKNLSGKECGYDVGSYIGDTALGAGFGLFPGSGISEITKGRGSFNSIYKQIVTKASNGTIKNIGYGTANKMFWGRYVNTGGLSGFAGSGFYNQQVNSGY
jgi:type VI secretion system secreted protein VgrG